MTLKLARNRLTTLWFSGGLAFILLLVVQSLRNVYGDATDEVWGWALPTIVPTLLLIVGVLVGDQLNRRSDVARVTPALFRLTYWLSAFYLGVVALTVLLAPLSPKPPIELMKMSNFWLGPIQGLVTAAFGAFFVDQRADRQPAAPEAAGIPGGH